MVGLARFELTTSCTPCKRSTRLNYSPTFWCPSPRRVPQGAAAVLERAMIVDAVSVECNREFWEIYGAVTRGVRSIA